MSVLIPVKSSTLIKGVQSSAKADTGTKRDIRKYRKLRIMFDPRETAFYEDAKIISVFKNALAAIDMHQAAFFSGRVDIFVVRSISETFISTSFIEVTVKF